MEKWEWNWTGCHCHPGNMPRTRRTLCLISTGKSVTTRSAKIFTIHSLLFVVIKVRRCFDTTLRQILSFLTTTYCITKYGHYGQFPSCENIQYVENSHSTKICSQIWCQIFTTKLSYRRENQLWLPKIVCDFIIITLLTHIQTNVKNLNVLFIIGLNKKYYFVVGNKL